MKPLRASSLERVAGCPGSYAAELPIVESGVDAFAEECSMLHRIVTGHQKPEDKPDEDQEALATRGTNLYDDFLTRARQFHGDNIPKEISEEPLSFTAGKDKTPLVVGHPDIARLHEASSFASVFDFKFGFLEVIHAKDNPQLAAYALMLAHQFKELYGKLPERVYVGIGQPRMLRRDQLTDALYEKGQLTGIASWLRDIRDKANAKDAPRIVGKWCQNCRAKAFCPEYKGQLTVPGISIDLKPKDITTVSNDDIRRLTIACKFAARIKETVTKEMTRRIEAGEIADWEMEETGSTRTVTDATKAYQILSDHLGEKMTAADFMDVCKIGQTKLHEMFCRVSGMRQEQGKRQLRELLAPVTETKQKAATPVPKEGS